MTPDRLSGAFFLLFGLAMYFAIIPVFVEQAEDGSIAPNTLPNILSWMVAISGGWLVLKPTPHQIQDLRGNSLRWHLCHVLDWLSLCCTIFDPDNYDCDRGTPPILVGPGCNCHARFHLVSYHTSPRSVPSMSEPLND